MKKTTFLKLFLTGMLSCTLINAQEKEPIAKTNQEKTKAKKKPTKKKKKKSRKSPQSSRTKSLSPEEQIKTFKLQDGFIIELVASEKDGIINPIDMTFDDAGRLWTQTASMYPLDPAAGISFGEILKLLDDPEAQKKYPEFTRVRDLYEGRVKGDDKILIIEDPTKAPTKAKVFADGLAIPQSILPYKNGAFVAHGSQMLFLGDSNGDGKADKRETVLEGFGFTDTHTMSHLLVRAPGGWVNFSHGALNKGLVTAVKSGAQERVDFCKNVRFSLDGNKIELVSTGRDNIWGYQLRHKGQWYGTQANDRGDSVMPMEPGTGFSGIGGSKLRSYQPMMPSPLPFRVGGTGISGLAFADDTSGSFPASEWENVAFLANPITSKINCVRISRAADGSIKAEHLKDFLSSEDDWFRPVNIEFGPDGCLYIADWYNKVISHNEVSRAHPDRDKKHGRIWRIRHESQKPRQIPNFYKVPNSELTNHLKSPSLWAKRAAWHQIADREAKELAPQLIQIAADKELDETTRIHALWSLESIKHYDHKLMNALVGSELDDLRREAVRALAHMPVTKVDMAKHLKPLIAEKNVLVRSQVLRTIENYSNANDDLIDILVSYCLPDIPGAIKIGQTYERKFERFLARRALERFPYELNAYLKTDLAKKQPASHITWASQALPKENREEVFLAEWNKSTNKKIDETRLLIIARMLRNPKVYDAVKESFNDLSLIPLALKHQAAVQSKKFSTLLKPSVRQSLNSSNPKNGLQTAVRFKISGLDSELQNIIKTSNSEADIVSAIQALSLNGKGHLNLFQEIVISDKAFTVRHTALLALLKSDANLSSSIFPSHLTKLKGGDKKLTLDSFSSSDAGSKILLNSLKSGSLTSSDFDMSMAERIHSFNRNDKLAKNLFIELKKVEAEEEKAFKHKLEKYMHIAKKNSGNPAMGKPLFTALCLSCHAVGSEGAGFAPPLDGSAHRENEALLTAILNPDAAVESNYYLYRLLKKDGTTIEGYREKSDERGATMRFMGGGSMFIPASDIQKGHFVGKRSVMPKGLIDSLSTTQVADVLAYIKSLK
ncbi:MAG: c-type cytochrome [Lentisphaeraceae bacterium]|nr:c-type cytochrome [Lentisphaeraceae bacterium]